jgi:S-adenosylmethionine uptake transporter
MLVMLVICRMRGVTLATPLPGMHVWRNVVGVSAMTAWFYSIAHLPLATALTLNYMSGVWVAVFVLGSTLLTGRLADIRRQAPLAVAVVASFIGVLLMLRPTVNQDQIFPGMVGLMSGLMAAMAVLQIAALARMGEPEGRTVFYFSLACTVTGFVGAALFEGFHWHWPEVWWLIGLGILAALGQLCSTRAYSRGATIVVANLNYSGIVFAAIYGALLFGDRIPLVGWAGIALIVGSGIAATLLRGRAVPARTQPKAIEAEAEQT